MSYAAVPTMHPAGPLTSGYLSSYLCLSLFLSFCSFILVCFVIIRASASPKGRKAKISPYSSPTWSLGACSSIQQMLISPTAAGVEGLGSNQGRQTQSSLLVFSCFLFHLSGCAWCHCLIGNTKLSLKHNTVSCSLISSQDQQGMEVS